MNKITKFATTALVATIGFPAMAQQTVNFAVPAPPNAHFVRDVLIPWAESVTEESDGTINVRVRTGKTLASSVNVYERVRADVAQMGWGQQSFMKGRFKRSSVAALPFEASTSEEASVALWRLYEKGVVEIEYEDVYPLALIVFPPYGLHSNEEPITSLEDLGGRKIAIQDKISADIAKQLGAGPRSVNLYDMYQGLNRGSVDSIWMGWTAVMPFKLFEVTKHHYDAPLGASTAMVFMSKKAYDRLPEAGRRAIDEHSGEEFSRSFGEFWDHVGNGARTAVSKMPGHTFAAMPETEVKGWRDRLGTIADDWQQATPDGAKVLEAFRAEITAIRSEK